MKNVHNLAICNKNEQKETEAGNNQMPHSHKPLHEKFRLAGLTSKPDWSFIYLIWVGVIPSVPLDSNQNLSS
jgi:hypothetical protein